MTAEFRMPNVGMPEMHMPRLRMPKLRMPTGVEPRALAETVEGTAKAVRGLLPPGEQLAYYTGLGVLTAFELVEWPVALAIGAGTAVAQRNMQRTSEARNTSAQPRTSEAKQASGS